MAWKPGQSGNPKGRPPSNPEVRAAIAARLPSAVEYLGAVLEGEVDAEPKDRVQAAKILLEWGLAKPAVEAPKTDGNRLAAFVDMLKGKPPVAPPDDTEDDDVPA